MSVRATTMHQCPRRTTARGLQTGHSGPFCSVLKQVETTGTNSKNHVDLTKSYVDLTKSNVDLTKSNAPRVVDLRTFSKANSSKQSTSSRRGENVRPPSRARQESGSVQPPAQINRLDMEFPSRLFACALRVKMF